MSKIVLNTKGELKDVLVNYVNKPELYGDLNDKYDYSSITDMSGLFLYNNDTPKYNEYCNNEKYSVFKTMTSIPPLDTKNVTDMRAMFAICEKLGSIPNLNTSNVTDMESMFEGCSNLSSIPPLDISNVTDMKAMFRGCNNLPLEEQEKILNRDEYLEKIKWNEKIKSLEEESIKKINSIDVEKLMKEYDFKIDIESEKKRLKKELVKKPKKSFTSSIVDELKKENELKDISNPTKSNPKLDNQLIGMEI